MQKLYLETLVPMSIYKILKKKLDPKYNLVTVFEVMTRVEVKERDFIGH